MILADNVAMRPTILPRGDGNSIVQNGCPHGPKQSLSVQAYRAACRFYMTAKRHKVSLFTAPFLSDKGLRLVMASKGDRPGLRIGNWESGAIL